MLHHDGVILFNIIIVAHQKYDNPYYDNCQRRNHGNENVPKVLGHIELGNGRISQKRLRFRDRPGAF